MPLTITLADPLAGELQSEAAFRKISVEQFAIDTLKRSVEDHEWRTANERRLSLIRRQFSEELTPSEAAELQTLQGAADARLEAMDLQMLNDIAKMEKTVMEAVHATDC